jgi:two-component system OmpR family response regulator
MQQPPSLNITVVEDDPSLCELIVTTLRAQGHHVVGLEDAESIDDEGGSLIIDLLITDLGLPGESGLSLSQRFRQAQPGAGVMMVTAMDKVADKVNGYEHGADIYLTKPVDPAELNAAVRAFARRHNERRSTSSNLLTLNPSQLSLNGEQGSVSISRDEALILAGLARAPGQMLEYWQLLELLEMETSHPKSALEVRIVRLRKKITEAGHHAPSIKSVRSKGYQLSLPLRIV